MDRNKALEKIQKCLALGKSPNEHEAAAAMRQAQALMRNFGITDAEIGLLGYGSEAVQTAIQAGKKIPLTLSELVYLIRHAFGVSAVYERRILKTDANFCVVYYGREDRVMLAGYAHSVVARAVEQSWQKHLKENPYLKGQVGSRAGFYAGWIHGVQSKVEAFATPQEEIAKAKTLMESMYPALRSAVPNNMKVDGRALRAGAAASEGFSLHTPMNGRETVKIGR